MTAPASDLPWNIFGDREQTREATWYARIFTFINSLRNAADPMGTYWAARAGTTVSVPSAAWTAVPLDTVTQDSDTLGLNGTGGFTAPTTGIYFASAAVGFAATALVRCGCAIGLNGTAVSVDGALRIGKAAFATEGAQSGATLFSLTAGDTLTVYAWQESGAAKSTSIVAGERASLTVTRIR